MVAFLCTLSIYRISIELLQQVNQVYLQDFPILSVWGKLLIFLLHMSRLV